MKRPLLTVLCLFGLLASTLARDPEIRTESLTNTVITKDLISMQPLDEYERFVLTVKGPDGIYFRQNFDGVSVPFIETYDVDGNALPDGQYAFELRATPILSQKARAAMAEARESGDYAAVLRMRETGAIPAKAPMQSGYFRIENGFIVVPQQEESVRAAKTGDGRGEDAKPGTPIGGGDPGGTEDAGEFDNDAQTRDQIIADDLIVTRSICVGFDCVNGEVFGFDTIKLKENNLRIKFEDTSVGAFPSNDWQLTANDSASGGANKFSIDDISGGRTPFTVEARAPSHSLYVDDGGRVGFGTSTPVTDLHVVDGDSPTLRLQQDGSSGFAPQTWDVAGNETSFFVRDATNGSTLPFRIRPGAPSSSIHIDVDGDVGIGTSSPDEKLDVEGGNLIVHDNGSNVGGSITAIGEDSSLSVTRDSSTPDGTHMIATFTNNGASLITMQNTASASNWFFGVQSNTFVISADGSGATEAIISPGGAVTFAGIVSGISFNATSDRNLKENIKEIDEMEVLERALSIPIYQWNFKEQDPDIQHIGPMAQDFWSAFQLGNSDKHIPVHDYSAVAMSSVKGLHKMIQEKDGQIQTLKGQLQEQDTKLKEQEARLKALEDALLK